MSGKERIVKGRSRRMHPPVTPANPRARLPRLIAAILVPLVLVGAAYYAYGLTMDAWTAVVEYQSPYLFETDPVLEAGAAATDGVLLIIIDGLRVDTSRELATLNQLRTTGADLTAITGQPSLSNPAAAVIPSGTLQEIHGVTTNWYEGELLVDNILLAARRGEKSTAVVAGKGWTSLYGSDIDDMYEFDDSSDQYDENVLNQALAVLESGTIPDLMIVHFGEVDHFGHSHGGASPEYLAIAHETDGFVARLLEAYDLSSRTVIITADHGHIDTGGHGGWEPIVINVPLVMAGQGIKAGTYADPVRQEDIAPTIAALLGVGTPTHTTGTLIDQALDLPAEDLAKAFINLGYTRHAFSREYVATVAEGMAPSEKLATLAANVDSGLELVDQAWVNLVGGDPALAVEAVGGALYLMDTARAEAKELRMAADRASRVGLSLALVLLPLAALVWLARNRGFGLAVLGAVLYFAAWNSLFFLIHGYQWSLSIFNNESSVQSFFMNRMLEAAIVMIVVAAVFGLLTGRKRGFDGYEVAEGAAALSLLVAWLLGAQGALFYYLYGLSFDWFVPNLLWGFKFYVDMMQFIPTSAAAFLVVPVALLFAKLASLFGGPRAPSSRTTAR